MEHINVILAAVATFIATILLAITPQIRGVLNAYLMRFQKKFERSSMGIAYRNGIERLAEFHAVLEQIRELDYVDRVLVLVGKNGGGTPQPGKSYTVEALHGWSSKPDHHPEKAYNYQMRVDSYYMDMIVKMIKEGYVVNKTSEMPPKALLTSLYKEEGVFESMAFSVQLTDNELIFLSVANYKQSFTELQVAKLTMYLARMRSIFTTTIIAPEAIQ